ncbi:MAG TPA: hypothetical protein VES67_24510 [Vicinamibacterales bacterium]|nr:hypothetical protein [Vicinamibacterales bacterium]
MNRRRALAMMMALPLAARVGGQTRPTGKHRVIPGVTHGLLLEPGGTLRVWSCNPASGDTEPAPDALGLGHNEPVDSYTLYPVPGLTGVVAAAVSSASYAVLADGQILAWGAGGAGVLGTTPLSELEERAQPRMRSNTPSPVAVKFDAVDVSAQEHVLARARDGSVYAWGRGDFGQLGIGPLPVINFRTRSPSALNYMPFPVRVPNLADVVAISAGARHSLALLKDGTVQAWGENKWGQIGDGTTVNRDTPTPVPGVRDAVAIAAGSYFSVAVLSDGTAIEWGSAYENLKARPVPAPLTGAGGLRSVAAGLGHVVAITQSGGVMTWGANTNYDTGRGRNATTAPALVSGLRDVQTIAANTRTSTAVLASGRIMTWGGVRPWTRPDVGGAGLSPFPILLWLDGLDQT